MIEPTRQEILARLARLSELAPDMRFGQLVANLAFLAVQRYACRKTQGTKDLRQTATLAELP